MGIKGNNRILTGLSKEEVKERVQSGKANICPKAPSRTFGQILQANLFTRFNAINAVLAVLVIIAGSPKNALFSGVIISNTLIGIIQEVRAKKTLEKMALLNISHSKVLREGKEVEVEIEDIVLDDVVVLIPGIQILADGMVIEDYEFEVDEAMLTGESDPVLKKAGDELFAGSFIVSGSGYGLVTKVGAETYSAKLANEAKKFKRINSELQVAVNKILTVITWLIVPIGSLLVFTQIFFTKRTWQEAIISASAGIVGMVPEGLVLLTSLTFVVGIVRLSKWNTLVQELPATEVLARVDTLCLDKTGTITEGRLNLIEIISLGNHKKEEAEEIIASIAHAFPSTNPTQQSILDKYNESSNFKVIDKIPFSSHRKWSALEFEEKGAWVLGAPEMILMDGYEQIRAIVEKQAVEGRRVLLLAKIPNGKLNEELSDNIEGVALLLIEDIIRKEAPKTLEYFRKEGVTIKIISGDNPVTVSAVAKRAGVYDADNYFDARNLPENIDELAEIIEKTTVFGRVTPHQKKELVKALQSKGHVVAMTGDGVNDVLALKESDCGIAMASGSDAAKAVSQLVLLDSNFSALPEVVLEGRRMINNLEGVSELYLNKTVYSTLLSLIFVIIMLPYPFNPINITLIGTVAIGIPSFFLALGPNTDRVKSGYLRRVMSVSITNGIVLSLSTIAIFVYAYKKGLTVEQCRTLGVMVAGGISLVVLLRVAKPLKPWKATLVISMVGLFSLAFIVPLGRSIFSLNIPDVRYIFKAVGLIVISGPVISCIIKIYNSRKLVK